MFTLSKRNTQADLNTLRYGRKQD